MGDHGSITVLLPLWKRRTIHLPLWKRHTIQLPLWKRHTTQLPLWKRGLGGFSSLAIIFTLCALCPKVDAVLEEDATAERLYEYAFRLIMEGDYGEAYEQMGEVMERYPGTLYARSAEARRQRLEELDLPGIRRRKVDQSGRIEAVVFGTLYTTWLGMGSAWLARSEEDDTAAVKSVAAGMMIGAPAGLLASLRLTRGARLTDGQAALVSFGGYWGTWQGYGLAILLDRNDDDKTMLGSAIAGGLTGILTTSALTRWFDVSLGDAGMINYGGLWGTWLSFCTGMAAELDEDSDEFLGALLLGGNLGTAATAALAPKVEISLARASLINLSGIVGTIMAGGWLLIREPDSRRSAFATLIAGGVLGIIAGGFGTMGVDAGEAQQALDSRVDQSLFDQAFSRSLNGKSALYVDSRYLEGGCREGILHARGGVEVTADILSVQF